VCGCRRRPQNKLINIKRGGIATAVNVEDEYHLLVQAATLWRVGREMSHRQLGTHDLYHAFNGKRDGYLTCGELAASRSAGGASRGRGAPLQACSGPSP
jgi:hypothetical protein